MGYSSKALLYIEGAVEPVKILVAHANSKRSKPALKLVGSPSVCEPYNNHYDFISDGLLHEIQGDRSTIVFSSGWFKAYNEWEVVVDELRSKSGELGLNFHYCRFGENADDVVIENPEDGPYIEVGRVFCVPEELWDVFGDVGDVWEP
jgi:hypothetical protein